MKRFDFFIQILTDKTVKVAQAALAFAMLVTVANVITRIRWNPIPGAIELTEMAGAVILSMSVAYTAMHKGHIVVGVLMEKFSVRTQAIADIAVNVISFFFLFVLAKHMFAYAGRMMSRGLVTGHLNIPIAPSIYLVGFGFVMLMMTTFIDMIRAVIIAVKGERF